MIAAEQGSSGATDFGPLTSRANWTIIDDLTVGLAGPGSLLVEQAGQAKVEGGFVVASDAGSSDSLSLLGPDATLIVQGSAQAGIQKYSTATFNEGLILGAADDSSGALTVDSVGSITVQGDDFIVGHEGLEP